MSQHSLQLRLSRYLISALVVILFLAYIGSTSSGITTKVAYAQSTPTPIILTPIIRFPVVADAPVAGYVDHKIVSGGATSQMVQQYQGRANPNSTAGFSYTCSLPGITMNDWVGCTDNVNGEGNCTDANELWYDEYLGTDFEYFPDWHTGATCNVNLHPSTAYVIPIFSAATGLIEVVTTEVFNGYYYRIKSNANNIGNSPDDDVRVWYLHLRSNTGVLSQGLSIPEGHLVALGDMTGYASTPHLHLHVARMINSQQQVVDPFGWTGSGNDPYPYRNQSLWSYRSYAPFTLQTCTGSCSVVTQ